MTYKIEKYFWFFMCVFTCSCWLPLVTLKLSSNLASQTDLLMWKHGSQPVLERTSANLVFCQLYLVLHIVYTDLESSLFSAKE